jgi:RNA polymerase sigma factor (sigma-70 family)
MTRTEFEHIAAQLRQRVLKVGLDFFGNQEDAEDAAQETMVQLWRYCEHIDAERNVEALAVKMAKNCCISMYRKRHHAESGDEVFDYLQNHASTSVDSDPQAQLEAEDMQRMLDAAMAHLNPRERQLF